MRRTTDRTALTAAAGAGTPRDVIFEFSAFGNAVKVCAVDAETMIEVAIVGPASADEATLRRAALAKLDYVLDRRRAVRKGGRGIIA